MNRKTLQAAGTTAVALALAVGMAGCGAKNEASGASSDSSSSGDIKGTLNAAGSSAQEAAVSAWKQSFQSSNPDVTVNYDPVGSGGGREQFISGGVQVAGSDAAISDDELTKAKDKCGSDIVEVPVYVSPIAIVYNVKGVDDLTLSPQTAAKIFLGKITTWDDAAIKKDNPGASLPSTRITAVHRSDDSGTTENFTDFLNQTAGGVWTDDAAQTWPVKNGEGAEGTSGVVSAVKGGNGTIGYADESQAGKLDVAKIKIGGKAVGPTADGAAAVLDDSKSESGRSASDIAITINRTSTKGYPLFLVSYQMTCAKQKDAATADLVKGWLTYVASSEGQKAAAEGAGSAPLPDALAGKASTAIEKITS